MNESCRVGVSVQEMGEADRICSESTFTAHSGPWPSLDPRNLRADRSTPQMLGRLGLKPKVGALATPPSQAEATLGQGSLPFLLYVVTALINAFSPSSSGFWNRAQPRWTEKTLECLCRHHSTQVGLDSWGPPDQRDSCPGSLPGGQSSLLAWHPPSGHNAP